MLTVKCKHELQNLCGTADGILCRRCGLVFKSFAELRADAGEPEDAPAAPKAEENPAKRGRKKKGENEDA
jgi:hypothetical protein